MYFVCWLDVLLGVVFCFFLVLDVQVSQIIGLLPHTFHLSLILKKPFLPAFPDAAAWFCSASCLEKREGMVTVGG